MPIFRARSRVPLWAGGLQDRLKGSRKILRTRTQALLGLSLLGGPMATAAPWDAASATFYVADLEHRFIDRWQPDTTPMTAAYRLMTSRPLPDLTGVPYVGPPQDGELSPAAIRVSMIARRNGDRSFLMVDKARGRIILFENGRPYFGWPALTGESLADRIPPDSWSKPWSEQTGLKSYKVTPAGRYTITRAHDRALGDLFDINELRGRDWKIAIHQVWLGRQSEHRDVRLRSAMDEDKHITNGCVDVDRATMVQLWRLLPGRGLPLYILPMDESLIGRLFPAREAPLRLVAGPQG